jgi:hypothetical protein
MNWYPRKGTVNKKGCNMSNNQGVCMEASEAVEEEALFGLPSRFGSKSRERQTF